MIEAIMNTSQRIERPSSWTAFTVLELFVSITVIAVMTAILLAAVVQARSRAGLVECQNNCRQVVIASLASEETGAGLPAGIGFYQKIYPFAEADDVIEALGSFQGSPADGGVPSPIWTTCPDDVWAVRQFGATSYLPSDGIPDSFDVQTGEGVYKFGSTPRRLNEIVDGLSNTVFAAERLQSPAFLLNLPQARFDPSFVAGNSARYHFLAAALRISNSQHGRVSHCMLSSQYDGQ